MGVVASSDLIQLRSIAFVPVQSDAGKVQGRDESGYHGVRLSKRPAIVHGVTGAIVEPRVSARLHSHEVPDSHIVQAADIAKPRYQSDNFIGGVHTVGKITGIAGTLVTSAK